MESVWQSLVAAVASCYLYPNQEIDSSQAKMKSAQRTRTKRAMQLTAEDARNMESLKKSSEDAKRKAIANGLPYWRALPDKRRLGTRLNRTPALQRMH